MVGVERDGLLQAPISKFVSRGSQDACERHRQAVFASETKHSCEMEMRKADGAELAVRLESIAFGPEHGRRCRTTLVDLTERRQAEVALQQLNDVLEQRVAERTQEIRRLITLIETAHDAIYTRNLDGTIASWNRGAERLYGYTAHEAIGRSYLTLVPNDCRDELDEKRAGCCAESRSRRSRLSGSERMARRFSSRLPILRLPMWLARLSASPQSAATLPSAYGRSRPCSKAQGQLRAVLNTAADAIITIDQRGIINGVNAAAETMFGYAHDELVGQNVKILMPPPYRDEHAGYLERYLQTGEARIIGIGREALGRRKDGSTFPVDLAVSEVEHLGLFTGIIRDISERKELQQHVLEIANEEQQRIGQELHDVTGQELTGLSLFAGRLPKILRGATQVETTGNSIYQLEEADFLRLQQIAARLSQGLTLANRHVHELSHGLMPVKIDAEGLRSALVELAAIVSDQENITCRFECSGPVTVANNATATHLYRIAQESLHNALLHSRADQIQIFLSQQDEQIVLEVRDNGVGIDRTAGARAGAPAKGMGLRIMDYRAGMIGGLFRVERNQPNGTRVRCTAPLGG